MARKIDKNSTRQKALRELDKMKGLKREECLKRLAKKFPDAAKAYLETLWATHRRMAKEQGAFITVYEVRDQKNGVPCEPYLYEKNVFKAPEGAAVSPKDAFERYLSGLKEKEKTVLSMMENK